MIRNFSILTNVVTVFGLFAGDSYAIQSTYVNNGRNIQHVQQQNLMQGKANNVVYSTPNQFGAQQKSQTVQQSGNNVTMQQLLYDFDNIKKAVNTMESHINMFKQTQNTQPVQYSQQPQNIQYQQQNYKQNTVPQRQQLNYNVRNTQQQQYVQPNMSNMRGHGQAVAPAQYYYK